MKPVFTLLLFLAALNSYAQFVSISPTGVEAGCDSWLYFSDLELDYLEDAQAKPGTAPKLQYLTERGWMVIGKSNESPFDSWANTLNVIAYKEGKPNDSLCWEFAKQAEHIQGQAQYYLLYKPQKPRQ